jgi:hypothetical protein
LDDDNKGHSYGSHDKGEIDNNTSHPHHINEAKTLHCNANAITDFIKGIYYPVYQGK